MKGKFQAFVRRALRPHWAIGLATVLAGAAGLVLVFTQGWDRHPAASTAYLASAYALCVLICAAVRLAEQGRARVRQNRYAACCLGDPALRSRLLLCCGTGLNVAYAVWKLALGVVYRSIWFGTTAGYYMILSVIRLSVIRAGRYTGGDASVRGWRVYRRCGALLLVLHAVLAGMVAQMVFHDRGYAYPGFVIYAIAAYTFYRMAMAVMRLVRRRREDPIARAMAAVDLAAALTSMLSLQTAMFAAFGGTADDRRQMNAATGGVVCAVVMAAAAYMLWKSSRMLRRAPAKTGSAAP